MDTPCAEERRQELAELVLEVEAAAEIWYQRRKSSHGSWDGFFFNKGNSRFADQVCDELKKLPADQFDSRGALLDAAEALLRNLKWDIDYPEPVVARNQFLEMIDKRRR